MLDFSRESDARRWRRSWRQGPQLGRGDDGVDAIFGRRGGGEHFERQNRYGLALDLGFDDGAAMENAAGADMRRLARRSVGARALGAGRLAEAAEHSGPVIGRRAPCDADRDRLQQKEQRRDRADGRSLDAPLCPAACFQDRILCAVVATLCARAQRVKRSRPRPNAACCRALNLQRHRRRSGPGSPVARQVRRRPPPLRRRRLSACAPRPPNAP